MGWIRARKRWGGLAALVALAVQFVLAFGHIHADELRPTAAAASTQSATPGADTPGHDDHDEKFCDICATIHALGVAQLAVPPFLALPVAFAIRPQQLPADAPAAPHPRAAFRSRAPPTA